MKKKTYVIRGSEPSGMMDQHFRSRVGIGLEPVTIEYERVAGDSSARSFLRDPSSGGGAFPLEVEQLLLHRHAGGEAGQRAVAPHDAMAWH